MTGREGVVAITGVTGFIGSAVARWLTAAGWRVRGLARSSSQARMRLSAFDKLEIVEGSLEDSSSLRQLVRGSRVVIHCAGAVRGAHAEYFNRVNADGVAALVRIAREMAEKPAFIHLSSLAAREPQLSAYAASKKEGERQLALVAGEMPWIALRPPAVYGPGDREMLPLFRLMEKGVALLVGERQARFSMLYVDDLAAAIQSFLEQPEWSQTIYELHDGQPGGYSWDEVVVLFSRLRAKKLIKLHLPLSLLSLSANMNQFISRLTGKQPMLTPGKIRELRHPDWVCDNQAITEKIGWQPKVSLGEGLQRTMKW
ncbi:MAG: NAD-dependent epimerase/dehydratase family protein [Pseudomonadota bacterium]|nr:NAD-dependent epimerase/dehydratase family protein [Pseudomonadota bacterium]